MYLDIGCVSVLSISTISELLRLDMLSKHARSENCLPLVKLAQAVAILIHLIGNLELVCFAKLATRSFWTCACYLKSLQVCLAQ